MERELESPTVGFTSGYTEECDVCEEHKQKEAVLTTEKGGLINQIGMVASKVGTEEHQ